MSSEELEKYINKILNEATSESGSRGSYVSPLVPGTKDFDKSALAPFNNPVSEYNNALLAYDSYDKKMDVQKKVRKELETKSRKITNYLKKHPSLTSSDDDGNIINQTPGKGKNIVPVNEWIEVTDELLNEDLAVWFGKKKKPKGSSQPKGPWVDICRKVDGKHPPCGRPDTSKGSYPKCRAAGVAGKMSDSAKKAACAQKRAAEKKDPQSGKGQKPVMTSYKPRKK